MKILYVTTISNTMTFFIEHIKMLLSEGHSVELACSSALKPVNPIYNELGCKIHEIPFSRNPFSLSNLKAYKKLKTLVTSEHYDIVHCHTPNAAMVTRFACRNLRKQGTRVFYTAHGFHFFKGAPLKNWLMYYPVEKVCARWTDVLITINHEDFELAKKKMPAKKVCYVPGVGIDLSKIQNVGCDKAEVRKSMGVPEDCILLLSIGELSVRKNHQVVVNALAKLHNPNVHYAIAGEGVLKSFLEQMAIEKGVEKQVHLLGRRSDVFKLIKASDVSILPSLQEGLPVAMMEAMACGKPVICSKIRGSVDLIKGDCLCTFSPATNSIALSELMKKIVFSEDVQSSIGLLNAELIKEYSLQRVLTCMSDVYGGGK